APPVVTPPNAAQAANWNGPEAAHWVAHRDRHDCMLAPFADLLMAAAAIRPGEIVLDVGCGCGATTLAAAGAAGPGRPTGIDLAAPMLAEALSAHAGSDGVRLGSAVWLVTARR